MYWREQGLLGEFAAPGIDTPISESLYRAAAGAAVAGLRPVAQLMFVDFFGVCGDQIINQMPNSATCSVARRRHPSSSEPCLRRHARASQHSQCLYPIFTHIPPQGRDPVLAL